MLYMPMTGPFAVFSLPFGAAMKISFNRTMQALRFIFLFAFAARGLAVIGLAVVGLASFGFTAPSRAAPPDRAVAGPVAAEAHQKALTELFAKLRQAPDAQTAAQIRGFIVRLWGYSGSATGDLLMARAESLMKSAKGSEATALLDRIVALYPDWTLGWRRRAQFAVLQGDSEGAMLDLNHALGVESRDFMAMSELASLMRALGRNVPALELLRRALEIDPRKDQLRREAETLELQIEGNRI
jgi:tetratricopeptide (TPR) repeat protein